MDPVDETDQTAETGALRVTIGRDPDGTPVIALAGELDIAETSRAEGAFAELPAATDVVVDMTDLTFMDSAGLTVLLLAAKRGHAVRLRRPTGIIRQLIAATGLGEILPVEP
jgi:anti-anti-sigma factor